MARSGLVLLALLVTAPAALALDPDRLPTQYARAFWRAPDALPHDDVTSIIQTRDGYLWVGTVEGLARFDGVRSVFFDKSNTPAFSNNWVKAILEDRTGRLWVATFGGGLLCRAEGRFVRYDATRGLPEEIVLSLLEDREGDVWAGTGNGLYRLRSGAFARVAGTEALPQARVRTLFQDRAGTVWIGTDAGLYGLRDGALRRLGAAEGLADDRIMAFAEDSGGLWVATERGGICRVVGDRVTASWSRKEGLSHDRVWSLAVDRDGNLWIGTDGGGLDRLSHGRLASFSTRNGLTNDYVWALTEDRDANLWVGTNGGGLGRLKNGRVVPVTTEEGLPSDFVWSVRRTRDQSLWVGTEDAGLVRLQGDRRTRITTREGLSSNQVKTLFEDRDGTLWIGGNIGLDRWRNGRLERAVPAVAGTRIDALAQDLEGTLWIGSDRAGLLSYRIGAPDAIPVPGLSDSQPTALLAASDGSIWVGTERGLGHLERGRLTMLGTPQGLPRAYVTALFEEPPGTIWAATRGGLARIRGGVRSVTVAQGLFDDSLMLALPGDDGAIWLGGNRGAFRVARQDVEDVMDGRAERVHCLVLSLEDGLRSVEVNGGGSSGWKDPGGRILLATRAGLAVVDTSRLASDPRPPSVILEEVLSDTRPLAVAGGWSLPASSRRLSFRYTAIGLKAPSRIRFAWRLEGYDPDWVNGTQRMAEYTNLPHGSYVFRVKAANEDGVWNEQGASVSFEIQPRLRDTLWARLLAAALLVVAGPSFYAWRVRRLRRQKADLERLVVARTAELQAANLLLAQASREDPLTGVWNRRRLDEALAEEWRRAVRQSTPLGLLLLDVDYFKAFNDRLGHPSGDSCLKAVAHTVAEAHRRAGELVARYGGEEFAVLIPSASLEDTAAAAEAVRARIEGLGLPHPGSSVAPVVTVSVGAAWARPSDEITPADLVSLADRALYRAKQGGRNRAETEPLSDPGDRPQ